MNTAQIEQVLKLVTNNETAEKREQAIRQAVRLLHVHLKAAQAEDALESKVAGIAAKRTNTSRIRKRFWAVDDDYLVVDEFQVFAEDGFKEGDAVEVTVRKRKE